MAKNAKQLAKKQANIAAAQARLARLQAQQKLANSMRAKGHVGSDQTMMRLVNEEHRKAEEKSAREFVDRVLNGPHGERVRKFMGKGLSGNPTKVAFIVRNYLKTQGFNEAA